MKVLLKILLFFVAILVLLFGGIIILATVKNYKPEEKTLVYQDTTGNPEVLTERTFQAMIWNIGYCGLDAGMDFFYDGGEKVRPEKEQSLENLENVRNFLSGNDSVDFILLQEVDINSRRSYHLDQNGIIGQSLKGHFSFTGINYRVPYVPIPFKEPMGKVESGLQTLSAFPAEISVRRSFPGNYAWPTSLFMLDRCFLVNRYRLPQAELLIINTHNSAYDDGSLRIEQMHYLRDFILGEYEKGNYVLVGGDWNQCPPGINTDIPGYRFDKDSFIEIPGDFLPAGWSWVWDPRIPTNRRVSAPYDQDRSLTTIIDYYLLSPNLHALSVKTTDMQFRYSDHQPVMLHFSIGEKPGRELSAE